MQFGSLTDRLGRYLELNEPERQTLAQIEREEQSLTAGEILMAESGKSDALYIVRQGWMHSSVRSGRGGRQILGFHYAGDLIGTSSIAWARAATTLAAVSDCVVTPVPKVSLGLLFKAQPRIARLLYAIAAAENVAMSDRLTSIGRMEATDRLSTLLLDVLARLRVTAGGIVDSFDLPLTQTDLGDALGLTKVHVNRTLRVLERNGSIERTGRRIRIIDEVSLISVTGFIDRYSEVATDWLPSAS